MDFTKLNEILMNIPVVNLIPIISSALVDGPKYLAAVPQEKKQAFFNAAVEAGTVAMANYASKNSKVA